MLNISSKMHISIELHKVQGQALATLQSRSNLENYATFHSTLVRCASFNNIYFLSFFSWIFTNKKAEVLGRWSKYENFIHLYIRRTFDECFKKLGFAQKLSNFKTSNFYYFYPLNLLGYSNNVKNNMYIINIKNMFRYFCFFVFLNFQLRLF